LAIASVTSPGPKRATAGVATRSIREQDDARFSTLSGQPPYGSAMDIAARLRAVHSIAGSHKNFTGFLPFFIASYPNPFSRN